LKGRRKETRHKEVGKPNDLSKTEEITEREGRKEKYEGRNINREGTRKV
jgi:hypothetical protein